MILHLAWHLPAGWLPAGEIQRRARRRGVGVYPLAMAAAHHYGRYGPADRTLILGYTALGEDLIRRGVALIAASLKEPRAGAAGARSTLRQAPPGASARL